MQIMPDTYSDWLSFVGLFLTVAGFGWTLYAAYSAKSASEQTSSEVKALASRVEAVGSLVSIRDSCNIVEEIIRIHRKGPVSVLSYRYMDLRKTLIPLRVSASFGGAEDQVKLQKFVTFVGQMEHLLAVTPEGPTLTKKLVKQATALAGFQEWLLLLSTNAERSAQNADR